MKTIEEKIEFLNEFYESIGSEKRYWIGNNDIYFVCYNATSIMDDIDEVSEDAINNDYERILKNYYGKV